MNMPEEEIGKLTMTPAPEFIDSFCTFPGMFRTQFLLQCEGVFKMTCDLVSASVVICFFRQTNTCGVDWYYEYSIGRVFEVYAETAEELGGTVLFNTWVKSINAENNVASEITLENGDTYTTDFIVSDADIRQTVLQLINLKRHTLTASNRSYRTWTVSATDGF